MTFTRRDKFTELSRTVATLFRRPVTLRLVRRRRFRSAIRGIVLLTLSLAPVCLIPACGDGGTTSPSTPPVSPAPPPTVSPAPPPTASPVESLEVTGPDWIHVLPEPDPIPIAALTSIGDTVQLDVTAHRADDTRQPVDGALVTWESSDPAVATVSEGAVTAVAGGNTRITATWAGQSVTVIVSVQISLRTAGTARVVYAAPSDRPFRPEFSSAVGHAVVEVQSWFRQQLGGLTFGIYDATPQWCQMSRDSDYYSHGNAWEKIVEDVQHCAPVQSHTTQFSWIIYADVQERCDEPWELGRGHIGLTIVPRHDLLGLTYARASGCPPEQWDGSHGRWFGGLVHEFAHTLGVPHPPGCNEGLPVCDEAALMQRGYATYPDTYLRYDDKETLMRSVFVGGERSPRHPRFEGAGRPRIAGVVRGPNHLPLEGIRVSFVPTALRTRPDDDLWNWGESDSDGMFEVGAPDEASGSVALSVHAGDSANCGWLGYWAAEGLTSRHDQATRLEIGHDDALGVEVELPLTPDGLCDGATTISGVVVGPEGQPVKDLWLWAYNQFVLTGRNGTFELQVPRPWAGRPVQTLDIYLSDCFLGHYGPGGFAEERLEATFIELGAIDVADIEIRLPAAPHELCRRNTGQKRAAPFL